MLHGILQSADQTIIMEIFQTVVLKHCKLIAFRQTKSN